MWLITLLIALFGLSPQTEEKVMDPTAGLSLVWNEEFNRWRDVWTTRAIQRVDNQCARGDVSCARTRNGQMILSVKRDPDNPGMYLAGHVGTPNRKEFEAYGFFEARIKFPAIFGVLCGWWLAPVDDYVPDDPTTPANERGVEIDIVETGLFGRVHHTIWYRDFGQVSEEFHTPAPHLVTDLGKPEDLATYRDYGVLWTPTGYTFTINRVPVGTLTEGLSNRPVFPVLSMKIPKYLIKHLDDSRITEQKMYTKWIRVYQ